ncbi:MAG: hypothetical protein QW774_03495 [Candidatus Micrarchaeaceae archaeon]
MDETTIMYVSITSLIALLAILMLNAYGPFKVAVAILSILTILLILVINFADFLVFPLVTVILNAAIVPAKDYYINKHQNSVIKFSNGIYYATGYLSANLYSYAFSQERTAEEAAEEAALASSASKWERIIMNVDFPFKFHAIVAAQEIQEYRDELEGKRSFLEFQLSKEMSSSNPSQLAIDDYQRRISILQARIERLSSGERPVNSVMYIETAAAGVSEKAAVDALNAQLNHLQTVFNALDLSINRVVGRELYLLFKFNYSLPISASVLMDYFHQQK